ncbi:MAG: hypothetical protein ACKVS6_07925 [Planctomycetota bacterium]
MLNLKLPLLIIVWIVFLLPFPSVAFGAQKPASSPAKPGPQKPETEKPSPKDPTKKDEPKAPKKNDAAGGLVEVEGQLYTKDEKEKLDKGWRRLDYDWISPEEVPNIEKGMFKINGSWVTLEQADTYHANEETPWIIPTRHFAITSNVTRKQILQLSEFAEKTYTGMKEMFGVEPKGKMGIRIFNNVDAANAYAQQFAGGDRANIHSSVWIGYVAEDEKERPAIVLFDGEPGKGFSHLFMMHAVVHKYMDATFPDPDSIPEWFVEGVATYFERYIVDGLRPWALAQLQRRGGVSKLEDATKKFSMSSDDSDGSQTKMQLAALVIAYYAFGKDKKEEALFKKAIASMTKSKEQRASAIDKLIEDSEGLQKKLKAYAGF